MIKRGFLCFVLCIVSHAHAARTFVSAGNDTGWVELTLKDNKEFELKVAFHKENEAEGPGELGKTSTLKGSYREDLNTYEKK